MRTCPNDECPHRKLTRERAMFDGDRARCSDCESELVEGEPADAKEPPPAAPSDRWRRAAVSLGLVAAFELAHRVPSPFLSRGQFLETEGYEAVHDISALQTALVLTVSAFASVELVVVLVPYLRRRRHDHSAARRRMTAAAWMLAAFLCFSSGLMTIRYAEASGMGDTAQLPYLATFLAAPVVLWGALKVLDRWGFGGAWPTLLLWSIVAPTFDQVVFTMRVGDLMPGLLVAQAAWLGAWAALGWWFLRRRFEWSAATSVTEPAPAYRGSAGRAATVPLAFRAPLWGIIPLSITATLAAGLPAAAPFIPALAPLAQWWGLHPWARAGVVALMLLGVLAVLPRLPTSLRGASTRLSALGIRGGSPDDALARARRSTRSMALAACALMLVGSVVRLPVASLTAGMLVLMATALAFDLADEWRAHARLGTLTPLLRDQRVWLADATAAVLEREGVPAFVRGANYHQNQWWSAAQAPAVVMVPPDRLDEAREILAEREGIAG